MEMGEIFKWFSEIDKAVHLSNDKGGHASIKD